MFQLGAITFPGLKLTPNRAGGEEEVRVLLEYATLSWTN